MPISPPKKYERKKEPEKPAPKKKKETKKAPSKKPTKKKAATKLTDAEKWVADLNKEKKFKGKAQVRMMDQVKTPHHMRTPTGITSLDIALGGGAAAGGIYEIQGEESAGKTLLANIFCAENQRIHGDKSSILLAMTELRPDKSFARLGGFHVPYEEAEIGELEDHRIKADKPTFTDEELEDLKSCTGSVVVAMADTAETLFEIIINAVASKVFQIIVIDSMGALLTEAKREGDIGDRQFGGPAGPVTDFQNKLFPLLNMEDADGGMNHTTILAINQARANMGASKYERSTKAAMGAHAWKHGMLASILLEQGGQIREDTKGPVAGRTIRWKLTKGKAGTHDGKKGSYDYYHVPHLEPVFWGEVKDAWVGGVAMYNDLADTAKFLGLITVAGSWVTWEAGDFKCQGMDNFAQHLADNPELAAGLRIDCFREAGVFVRHK